MNDSLAPSAPGIDDLVRALLGFALVVAAVGFMADVTHLVSTIRSSPITQGAFLLSHLIVLAHLGGGLLLIAGIHPRVVVLTQLPILIGAVSVVDYGATALPALFSPPFATTALIMSLFVLWRGGGNFALGALTTKTATNPPSNSELTAV